MRPDKCSSMYTPRFLTTGDGWRTLSPMDSVRSAWQAQLSSWLTVVACQARLLPTSPHEVNVKQICDAVYTPSLFRHYRSAI